MELAAHVEKESLVFSNMEVVYSNLKAVNKVQAESMAQDEIFEPGSVRETNLALFVKGFRAVVNTEIQKTFDCITLIEQNIISYSAELEMLTQQLGVEDAGSERVRIQAKIAGNREEMAEAKEQMKLLYKRILVLEEQLYQLDSPREWV